MDYKSVVFLVLSVFLNNGNGEETLSAIGNYTETFSAKVYQLLSSKPGNILISPISIQTISALVETGASGETLEELSKAVSLPADKNELQESFAQLHYSLRNVQDVKIDSANKVYVRDSIKLSEDFKKSAEFFDAEVENFDATKSQESATVMNNWVQNKTHDKITDVVSPGDINEDSAVILINALYFNGGWEYPFEENFTEEAEFYKDDNTTVKVPMMYAKIFQFFYQNNELDASFLDLTYKDPEYALTIVLPNKRNGLAKLEENIEKVIRQRPDSVYEELLQVWIPKFKVEGTIDFKDVFEKLGVKKLFDEAELHGITDDKRLLKVSKIKQKTFIDVNEKGTEAAATSVMFLEDRISGGPPKFIADHPFIFILRQRTTRIIQFMGRYTGP